MSMSSLRCATEKPRDHGHTLRQYRQGYKAQKAWTGKTQGVLIPNGF